MPGLRTEKEVRGFLDHINYIGRCITKLTTICEPVFKLLNKNEPIVWNNDCQVAFKKIKTYLLNPHVLLPPMPDHPLLPYLAVHVTSMGCVLG